MILNNMDSHLDVLKELCAGFHTSCAKCDKEIYHLQNRCSACELTTCGGCGKILNNLPLNEEPHCQEGRTFTTWMILCGFDAEDIQSREVASRDKPEKSKAKKKNEKKKSMGVGYAGGYGPTPDDLEEMYEEYEDEDFFDELGNFRPPARPVQHTSESMSELTEKLSDTNITKIIRKLIPVLPKASGDFDPDTALPELILFRLSIFFDRVASLVRNDSISNMVERSELYYVIFEFLDKVSKTPGLFQLATEPRFGSGNPGLELLSLASDRIPEFTKDRSQSILVSIKIYYNGELLWVC